MAQLEDLYREIVLDHYKSPRNKGELEPPAVRKEGFNPLCGDEVVIYLDVDNDGIIRDVKFSGQGCSISLSAASMMSVAVKGKTVDEAREITRNYKTMLGITDDDAEREEVDVDRLGDLQALQGVMKFPTRIKCATLSFNTLEQGLDAD